jgi:hypothetical protein
MPAGDQTEDWVAHLASKAGFTVNKSQHDRAGWDHIFDLSLPRKPLPNDPLGTPPAVYPVEFR